MARAYSGVLGTIALSLAITRGLVLGMPANEILIQCLTVFFPFALLGYCIGYVADKTVSESVENRFRNDMARLTERATSGKSETPA